MAGKFGLGASLASLGQEQKRESIELMGRAAEQESDRNMKNKQIEQANKAGNQQLGSTLGAMGGMALGAQYGMIGGPMGALIGGAIGAIAGGLF